METMLNILWPREGVPCLRELEGPPENSTCHHLISHELFQPLGENSFAATIHHFQKRAAKSSLASLLFSQPNHQQLLFQRASGLASYSAHHKGDAARGCVGREAVTRVKREEKACETHLKVQTKICRVSVDCDRGEIIFCKNKWENVRILRGI